MPYSSGQVSVCWQSVLEGGSLEPALNCLAVLYPKDSLSLWKQVLRAWQQLHPPTSLHPTCSAVISHTLCKLYSQTQFCYLKGKSWTQRVWKKQKT